MTNEWTDNERTEVDIEARVRVLGLKNSRPLFTIIFKSKMVISRLDILIHLLKEF